MKAVRSLLTRLIPLALFVLVTTGSTLAQIPGRATEGPPAPSLNRSPSPLIGFAIIFILLVAVVAVSIMPSKRGHQD